MPTYSMVFFSEEVRRQEVCGAVTGGIMVLGLQ